MPVTVSIAIEDIGTEIASYDTINLYRGTDPSVFPFTGLPVATTLLVTAQQDYSLTDDTGSANYWYRYTLYNSGTTAETAQSDPWAPDGITLLKLRLEAARQANVGFSGVCSEVGSLTTLVDAALRDTGVDTQFLEGAWIYRPNAAASGDRVRRVQKDGFTASSGTLTFDRPYTNAPQSGEVYQVFGLMPPIDQPGQGYSWDRAVRAGLSQCWFVDQVNIGTGSATTRQRKFPIAKYGITEGLIRRVLLRFTDTNGIDYDFDASREGWFWNVVENSADLAVELSSAPRPDQSVIVEVNRLDAALYNDADVTQAPFDYAWRAVVWQAYVNINLRQPGKYAGELAAAFADFQSWDQIYRPSDIIRGR